MDEPGTQRVTSDVEGTSRSRLRRRLSELTAERRALLRLSRVPTLFVSWSDARVEEVNQATVEFTGHPRDQLEGMALRKLLTDGRRWEDGSMPGLSEGDGPEERVVVVSCADGATRPALLSGCPVRRQRCRLQLMCLRPVVQAPEGGPEETWGLSKPLSGRANGTSVSDRDRFPEIIGRSRAIRRVCQITGKVARTDSTVLIQGESGTGKELFARAIYHHSERATRPFVRVNCAALTETLLESELFGHVRGAFTGAIRDREGRFSQADGGTILLDEIGSMSLAGQTKLLRVLQEEEFEPVGSSETRQVDVRVIATTNVDLTEAVESGDFRSDLYYRLSVIAVELPPLRRRREDIPLLATAFARRFSRALEKEINAFHPQAIAALLTYSWPGNVRELENVIERAVVLEDSGVIRPGSLAVGESGSVDSASAGCRLGLRERLNLIEREILIETLRKVDGIRKEAAKELDIDPRNMSYFLNKHDITEEELHSR